MIKIVIVKTKLCTFILQDMGTIVVGKVESGKVIKGQNVIIMPNKVLNIIHSMIFRIIFKLLLYPSLKTACR